MTVEVKDVKKAIEKRFRNHILKTTTPGAKNFTFSWEGVKWELVNFKIDPVDLTATEPSAFLTAEWNNCTTEAQHQRWAESKTHTDTFSLSFREGLQLGMDVEVKEDLIIESAKVKFSAKLDLAATQTQTTTASQTMGVDETITVPACKRLEATAFLYTGEFDTDFQVSVKATGPFGYGYDTYDGNPMGYAPPLTIEDFLASFGMENRFDATGKLSGAMGIRLKTETMAHKPAKCPPDSGCVQANIVPPRA